MATGSFLSDVKKQAAKNIGASISKSGILGAAVGKTFAKRFGTDEEDTQVADALKEQGSLQSDNSAILTRIESVVMNIADNVYNLAAIMSNQATSMKEAQKLQQEKAFKDAAVAEETASEVTKVTAPTAAGTEGGDKKKGSAMSGILDSVMSTKNMFKGFLKRFAVVAVGVTAAIGAVAGISALASGGETKSEETAPTETPTPDATRVASPGSESPTPDATRVASPDSESPNSMMSAFTGAIEKHGGARGKDDASAVGSMMGAADSGDMGGFMAAAQAHAAKNPPPPPPAPAAAPAAPPPTPAATTTTPDQEAEKLKEYFQRPENAADDSQLGVIQNRIGTLKRAISSTKSLISSATTPEEKARNEDILKNQLEPGLEAAKQQKKAILDKARASLGIEVKSSGGAPLPNAAGNAMESLKRTEGGGSGGGGGGSGGGAAAVSSSPSIGTDIATASTSVAAASEPQAPKNDFKEINTSKTDDKVPATNIPSPIAPRGNLDKGISFESDKNKASNDGRG